MHEFYASRILSLFLFLFLFYYLFLYFYHFLYHAIKGGTFHKNMIILLKDIDVDAHSSVSYLTTPLEHNIIEEFDDSC